MVDMYDVWQWFQDHGEDLTFSMAGLNGFIRATDVTDFSMDTTAAAGATGHEYSNKSTPLTMDVHNVGQDMSSFNRKNPVTTDGGITLIKRRQDSQHSSQYNSQATGIGDGGDDGTVIPSLRQLSGYDTTTHAKNNDVKSQWVAFTPQDC